MSQDRHQILIVDDEAVFARAVSRLLARNGLSAVVCDNLGEARAYLSSHRPGIVLLDMRLPDGSGLDLLRELNPGESPLSVIVMTAFGDMENAVAAMKAGASDYLRKPVDMGELLKAVEACRRRAELPDDAGAERGRESIDRIMGSSPAMEAIRGRVEKIADLAARASDAPPTVLITGETGSGKDLVARSLHDASIRRDKPFVHVDCAALPDDLIEAELFGHEKGAYTGAHKDRPGLIEAARDGTLFLDEIGELPADLQTKLLAVLERRRHRRIGDTAEQTTNAWFLVATNRDLSSMVEQGGFRPDLYFRLNVLTINTVPLREHPEDIVELAKSFAAATASRYGVNTPALSAEVEKRLIEYRWPGNARELSHVIERAVLLSDEGTVRIDDLSLEDAAGPDQAEEGPDIKDLTLGEAEEMMIHNALEACQGNVSAAARHLGVTRMTLRHRMQKYGIGSRGSG